MPKDNVKRSGPGKRRARKFGEPTYGDRYTALNGVTLIWSPICNRYLPAPEDTEEVVKPEPPRVIGLETVYVGDEARYGGRGARVKLTGIFCRGRHLCVGQDDEETGSLYVHDDHRLAQLGGVQPGDGAEVHCWLPEEGRWGIVAHEIPLASELELFAAKSSRKKAKK